LSRLKYLILTPRGLFPADTGGKIRSSNLFRELAKVADTTIVSYQSAEDSPAALEEMRQCCTHLELVEWKEVKTLSPQFFPKLAGNMFSNTPYNVAKYFTRDMEKRIKQLLAENHYDALICDFLQAALNVAHLEYQPKILFEHNVEAIIRQRQHQKANNPVLKSFLYWDWYRTHRFEKQTGDVFDHAIMVSDKDCETMASDYGIHSTSSIPLGVDVDYFSSKERDVGGKNLVFTGSMDWLPNQDAITHYIDDVLPLLRKQEPVTFWIVGRNPPPHISKLAELHDDVRVTGAVEDIRPYLEDAAVYVVPLRIGGGTRIKIFEAMAMNRAIVSTTIGAEGLPVTHGQDILLADTPEAQASATVELLRDQARRVSIADAGCKLVTENYTWGVAAQSFADICKGVVERHAESPSPLKPRKTMRNMALTAIRTAGGRLKPEKGDQ
jgi:polysaccharide biosynthesis protein PslH